MSLTKDAPGASLVSLPDHIWEIADNRMPVAEFRLLCHLVRLYNELGHGFHEPQIAMAEVCKMDKDTVSKYVRSLERRGIIEIDRLSDAEGRFYYRLKLEP